MRLVTLERTEIMEWKCTPDLYNTYENIDQVNPKLLAIIEKWGFCFDEDFFFWRPERNGKKANIIKRRPLYWYPQKSTPAEKSKRKVKGRQLKL